jgi:hypothetical protein
METELGTMVHTYVLSTWSKQEDHEFEAILSYGVKPCLKPPKKKRKTPEEKVKNLMMFLHLITLSYCQVYSLFESVAHLSTSH